MNSIVNGFDPEKIFSWFLLEKPPARKDQAMPSLHLAIWAVWPYGPFGRFGVKTIEENRKLPGGRKATGDRARKKSSFWLRIGSSAQW